MTNYSRNPAAESAWRYLHGANQRAHQQGQHDRQQGHGLERNPYPYVSDEAYWWREGMAGRPFITLATTTDLERIAGELGT